jgi:hypothetical protein
LTLQAAAVSLRHSKYDHRHIEARNCYHVAALTAVGLLIPCALDPDGATVASMSSVTASALRRRRCRRRVASAAAAGAAFKIGDPDADATSEEGQEPVACWWAQPRGLQAINENLPV